MDPREVEQEIESLDAESRKVAELLSGLTRVEAPSNFEFGVRARIAEGAPSGRSILFPALKLLAPLSLVLLVAVIVVFYPTSPNVDTVKVDDPSSITAPSEAPSTAVRSEVSNNSERVSGPHAPESPGEPHEIKPTVARHDSNTGRRPRTGGVDNPSGGASRVDALKPANTINPPEFRATNRSTQNSNSGSQTDIPVREVLGIIGVSADPGDDGWKVTSTVDGSIARKSGIQSGDVIEAIDGRAVTSSTTFKGAFGGKTIRVRRDGKSLDVKLTN